MNHWVNLACIFATLALVVGLWSYAMVLVADATRHIADEVINGDLG